jgi:hypothetical protein
MSRYGLIQWVRLDQALVVGVGTAAAWSALGGLARRLRLGGGAVGDLNLDFYEVGVGCCNCCWATFDGRGPNGEPPTSPPLAPDHKVSIGGPLCEGSGTELWGWRADGAGLRERR